jgi:amino acid transporter
MSNKDANTPSTKEPTLAYSDQDPLQAQLSEELNPKRPWLNHFCVVLSYFTVAVALAIAFLEIVGFFYLTMTFLENILCVYIILFCVLAIITETNLFGITKDSKVLKIWAFRGTFYVFIGVLCLNAIDSSILVQGSEFQRVLFQNLLVALSSLLIGIGILYIVLGLLCVQFVNERQEHIYQERKHHAVEIKQTVGKYGALSAGVDADAHQPVTLDI